MYRNVKAEIARKELTLAIVADKLGITTSTLSQKLNGKYPLTLNEAKRIKDILGVDIPIDILFEEAV